MPFLYLQEENALLAYHDARDAEDEAAPTTPVTPVTPGSRSSLSSPGRRSAVRSVARRGSARQVHLQAKETRQCEAKLTSLRRRTRVNEWYLSQLKVQLQETAKLMQMKEHRLHDLRSRFDQAGEERQRLAQEHVRTQQMVDMERQELMQLHQEALTLREACYLPAQLKKKSGMLTKFLDQEHGPGFFVFFLKEVEGPLQRDFDDFLPAWSQLGIFWSAEVDVTVRRIFFLVWNADWRVGPTGKVPFFLCWYEITNDGVGSDQKKETSNSTVPTVEAWILNHKGNTCLNYIIKYNALPTID